jgi:hypothetical protein
MMVRGQEEKGRLTERGRCRKGMRNGNEDREAREEVK